MKKFYLLLLLLSCTFSLPAQDMLSLYIRQANRYAGVDLPSYRQRLSRQYRISPRALQEYYYHCGKNWGNVGLALHISHVSGRSMKDICRYYQRYGHKGWNRVLVQSDIRPGSHYYDPFYDRLHQEEMYWSHSYDRYHRHCHKHHYKRHYRDDDWDDDDRDDDDWEDDDREDDDWEDRDD